MYMNMAEISAYLIENQIELTVRKYAWEKEYTIGVEKTHEEVKIQLIEKNADITDGVTAALNKLRRMIERGNPEMLPPQLSYTSTTEDMIDDSIPY